MPLESPIVRDGDMGFLGYASRPNPMTLPAGMLQLSENMRLDRGVAVTRKGLKRMADSISPGSTPLTLPFFLTTPGPIIQSSYSGGIYASAIMRSPDETNTTEIIVLAGPDRAFTYLTNGTDLVSATWSDGPILATATDNLVTESGEDIVTSKIPYSITYPTSPDETVEPTDKVSLIQAFDRLYLLREADPNQPGWEEKYTNSSGITSPSSGVARVNVTAHGYVADNRVRIEGSVAAAFDGHEYQITAATPDTFDIAVPAGTSVTGANVANIKVRRVKPPLYWTGVPGTPFVRATGGIPNVGVTYRRLRSVGWANYINNRLIVPDGKQNLLISDILDPDTFDIYWQSFRVGSGGNDFVVAVHPWVDSSVLVFCRKSIWLATISQYPSPDGSSFTTQTGVSNLTLLTDEIGCCARRSIATAGQYIYFLSDAGVYRLDSRLDLKLRGDTRPLSDPINDQITNFNADLVGDAVGLYFGNRYYLALPLQGDDNNKHVLIYNQLTEQWESKDEYGVGINNFIVADVDSKRRVLISSKSGKLMLLEEVEDGDESVNAGGSTTEVTGRIVTRRYGMNTMTHKRFLRSIADVNLPDGASVSVTAKLYNPDKDLVLVPDQTNSTGEDEDYTLKNSIRQRAHYAEIEFTTSAKRPEIRNVSIEAAVGGLPQTETRHAA